MRTIFLLFGLFFSILQFLLNTFCNLCTLIFVKYNCVLRQFRYSYRRSWADSESGLTFLPSLTHVNIPFDMWHNIWVPKVHLPQSPFTWKGYIEEHYPKINRRFPLKIVTKPWREFGDKLAACCVTDYTGGWRWLVLKYNENTERVQTALYFLLLVFWFWYYNEQIFFSFLQWHVSYISVEDKWI